MRPLNPGRPGFGRRISFLGLDFDQIDENSAIDAVLALARQDRFTYLVTPNADHLVRLHRRAGDEPLWSAYRQATVCLCDSRILSLLARRSGIQLEPVPGSDLTASLLEVRGQFARAAVVGGNDLLMRGLAARYPQLTWIHHDAPPGVLHSPSAQQDIVEFVEQCSAELIFFAIGSPQSELICAKLAARQRTAGVGLCIGASLEFLTGAKSRAPRWMQKLSLEWLFRLMSEPARLWRRYLVEGPRIFRIWWRWRSDRSADRDISSPSEG